MQYISPSQVRVGDKLYQSNSRIQEAWTVTKVSPYKAKGTKDHSYQITFEDGSVVVAGPGIKFRRQVKKS